MKRILVFALGLAVTGAADAAFDKSARWDAWQAFARSYEPDLSDSTAELEPPETGRLATPILLAKDKRARATIVVDLSDAIRIDNYYPEAATKGTLPLKYARGHERATMRTAALELRKDLKLVCGAEFPVVTTAEGTSGVRIFLGASFAAKTFPDDLTALVAAKAHDGFAVRVKDGDIYIFGATPAGTLYGVQAFVENNTDLIWAYPGPTGAVYTPRSDFSAVWADAREIPAFFIRGWQGGDADWKMHNRSNYNGDGPERGFFFQPGGHFLCPQYYDFCTGLRKFNSMNSKGVRSKSWDEARDHACLSDPEFFSHAVETVPNVSRMAYADDGLVIGMDDNASVCHCPLCRAPIRAEDGRMLTPEKDGELFWSAWFYTYLNKVDDAIQKVRPGYTTSTWAYFFAKQKPPITVNKTIVPVVCTYPRSIYHEPVFSPRNEIWQKCYEGWINHSADSMLYDYYGLCIKGQPYAEIYREELAYQRAIGFLATSTEGFMSNDAIGTADERWCMARLAWNPDLDVERLHRRFNRRTYREAAPHFDRVRGWFRQAYYRAGGPGNLGQVADDALKAKIVAELEAAEKAVRHPKAVRLVAESCAAWRALLKLTQPRTSDEIAADAVWGLKDNKWKMGVTDDGQRCLALEIGASPATFALPVKGWAGKLIRVRVRTSPGLFECCGYPIAGVSWKTGARADACEMEVKEISEDEYDLVLRPPDGATLGGMAIRLTGRNVGWTPPRRRIDILSFALEADDGRLLMEGKAKTLSAEQIRELKARYAAAVPDDESILPSDGARLAQRLDAFFSAAEVDLALTPDAAIAGLRAALAEESVRTRGVSTIMNGWEGPTYISRLATIFARRGNADGVRAVYAAWETWDGCESLAIRYGRRLALMNFLKARKDLSAARAKEMPTWRKFLALCAEKAETAEVRASAALAAIRLDLADIGPAAVLPRVKALLMDEFAPNPVRAEAAKLLPDVTVVNGKTDWASVARDLSSAFAAGDWSNLARTCYSRQSRTDLQLDAFCAVVGRMRAAGESDRAKELLERGAKLLGYDRTPAQTLAAENAMIPAMLARAVQADINVRYGALEGARRSFESLEPKLEDENVLSLELD